MRTVLITGGCGFAGHHLVEHIMASTDWDVVVLDSLTYAGRTDRLLDTAGFDPARVKILWHDLRAPIHDYPQLDAVTAVLHVAAESHVDRSIVDPVPFVTNNVLGTLNMMEWCRHRPELTHVVQVSTDEVYGPAREGHSHAEWEPHIPSNPYSASKSGQEAIAISFWRTYGVPLVISNTMNLYGERQDPEKFVAMLVQKIGRGEEVVLHGRPALSSTSPLLARSGDIGWAPSSRHWLHARNHADALCWMLGNPVSRYGDPGVDRPDRWHVAGEERDVFEMAELVAAELDLPLRYRFEDYHSSRPGHDHRYALDSSKIYAAGWKPPLTLEDALGRSVRWMVAHPDWSR